MSNPNIKKCKECFTENNLHQQKTRNGKISIYSICRDCRRRKQSAATKNQWKNLDKIVFNTHKTCNKCGSEDIVIDRLGRHNSYCSLCFKKRQSENNLAYRNKTPDYQKLLVEKGRITKQNWTDDQKKSFSEKISISSRNRTEETIERMKESLRKHRENRDPEKTKEIYDKQRKTMLNNNSYSKNGKSFWMNASEEQLIARSEKRIQTIKNRSEKRRIEISKKRHETLKKNNRYGRSQIENECYKYLIGCIDKDTIRQKVCEGYAIDFYLPSYDLYIQFDGVFWHGRLHSLEQIQRMKKFGKQIIATMKNDLIQNERIHNLIRITDEEFKLNPKIIIERIENYENKPSAL